MMGSSRSDAPLMDAGLDRSRRPSCRVIGEEHATEMPATLLFDHPTVDAIGAR